MTAKKKKKKKQQKKTAKSAKVAKKKKAAKKKKKKKKKKTAKSAKVAKKKRAAKKKNVVLFVPEPAERARERQDGFERDYVTAWPCAGGGPTRSASVREPLAPPVEEAWRAKLDAPAGAGPVVSRDGVVYVPDTEGALYAIGAETGARGAVLRTAWISESSAVWPLVEQGLVPRDRVPVSSEPAVAGWQLLYGDDDGSFYAVRRGDAKILWRKGANFTLAARSTQGYQAPLVVEGTVFTIDADGNLHAADARSGKTHYSRFLRGRPSAPPALSPRHGPQRLLAAVQPLFGGEPSAVHAFEPRSGERCWRHDLPAPPGRGLATTRDRALVGGDFGLRALALRDGEVRWTASAEALGGSVRASLAVDRDRAYVASDEAVSAVETADGEVAWTRACGGPVTGLAAAGGTVWAAAGRSLVALDAARGKVLARTRLPGAAVGSPAIALGKVVVATASGNVAAYR